MVKFVERVGEKQDHFFVREDPARIYRGLKDMLVDEFGMDRIEEGHMEFNAAKPKDRIRIWAFKEKSPHTVIQYYLSWKAKSPRSIYKYDRPDDILKARISVRPTVITVYPGGDAISWLPAGEEEWPAARHGMSGLKSEHLSNFHRSVMYKGLVTLWYKGFYSKEIHSYKEEAEETMVRIHNLMREKFGVEKTIARTGATHYRPPWS